MSIVQITLLVLQLFCILFLLLPIITVTKRAFTKKEETLLINSSNISYGIIITAYKRIDQTFYLIESLLKQSYQNFHIYLVADCCSSFSVGIKSNKLTVLNPETPINSKVGSINLAIENFINKHTHIVIFDSDNLADPNFLKEMNPFFDRGFKAVQGFRKPKNLDTKVSLTDALGEEFYNKIDRHYLFEAGSSATLAGSGMAFEVSLYKLIMKNRKVIGGFDKILQGKIVLTKNRIGFSKNAIVYDEKVESYDKLRLQRARWINAYFKYSKYGFLNILSGIRSLNFNQFYFGLNHLRFPLFILAVVSFLFVLYNIKFFPEMNLGLIPSGILFTSVFIYIGRSLLSARKLLVVISQIPRFILNQVLSLLMIKKASKKFFVTEQSHAVSIDKIMDGQN